MHYIVKLCNYCLCWSGSAGRLLPASAGSFAPAPAFASFGLFSWSPSCCLRWGVSLRSSPSPFCWSFVFFPSNFPRWAGLRSKKQTDRFCLFVFLCLTSSLSLRIIPDTVKNFCAKNEITPLLPFRVKNIFESFFKNIFKGWFRFAKIYRVGRGWCFWSDMRSVSSCPCSPNTIAAIWSLLLLR